MPGGDRRTRWHFKLQAGGVRGITIVRSQKEVANKSGVPLGALVSIQTPSTRKSCALAQGFLDHAIQVSIACTYNYNYYFVLSLHYNYYHFFCA